MSHLRKKHFWLVLLIGVGVILVAIAYPALTTESSQDNPRHPGITLPSDFRRHFVKYAVVERRDGTIRDLYIDPASAAKLKTQGQIPNGAILIVDAFYAQRDENGDLLYDENGYFIKGEPFEMIHVAEKRAEWAADDFLSKQRTGNWNFASFESQSGDYFDEDLDLCFHCHRPANSTDFLYSGRLLSRFATTDHTQYFYCELSGRSPCSQ